MIIANATGLAEEGPFGVIALIILTPALASLIMLALKWLLLLCAMLFSYSLAGIAWVLLLFGPFFFWLLAANAVLNNAHTIDNVIDAAGQPEAKKPSTEA